MSLDEARLTKLLEALPNLTDGQLFWLESVVTAFNQDHTFNLLRNDIFSVESLEYFGDALRIHHCFSAEPFSKDKFEYVLETILNLSGQDAELAPKGNRGHDITVNGERLSLKTQADKNLKLDQLWISKFMELGKGTWGDNIKDLRGMRRAFLQHLEGYDRILSLRAVRKSPEWKYELIEIPKKLLLRARRGKLEIKTKSKQSPKPGYCYVRTSGGRDIYQLYFDAGSERKLQIKNILKSYCVEHATWEFTIPEE